ncbi:hypothetical protein B0H14DRAFT_2598063 [Mycena olivaceomarginata]|nr:hypothetical protein B0H14DRAFT_2598063 [Mycena olivaceomarginata]
MLTLVLEFSGASVLNATLPLPSLIWAQEKLREVEPIVRAQFTSLSHTSEILFFVFLPREDDGHTPEGSRDVDLPPSVSLFIVMQVPTKAVHLVWRKIAARWTTGGVFRKYKPLEASRLVDFTRPASAGGGKVEEERKISAASVVSNCSVGKAGTKGRLMSGA